MCKVLLHRHPASIRRTRDNLYSLLQAARELSRGYYPPGTCYLPDSCSCSWCLALLVLSFSHAITPRTILMLRPPLLLWRELTLQLRLRHKPLLRPLLSQQILTPIHLTGGHWYFQIHYAR